MNKKVLSCVMLIITLGISIFGIVNINDKKIYKNLKSTDTILNTNALTMMYETDYQSGEYQVSSESTWPQDGYVFNETLSSCENGGTLTWNSETNRVVMQANTSDKCYVYFDKLANTFEFKISNMIYKAEEEMTWSDWIGSKYNTYEGDPLSVSGPFVAIASGERRSYISLNEKYVLSSDLVLENVNYDYTYENPFVFSLPLYNEEYFSLEQINEAYPETLINENEFIRLMYDYFPSIEELLNYNITIEQFIMEVRPELLNVIDDIGSYQILNTPVYLTNYNLYHQLDLICPIVSATQMPTAIIVYSMDTWNIISEFDIDKENYIISLFLEEYSDIFYEEFVLLFIYKEI